MAVSACRQARRDLGVCVCVEPAGSFADYTGVLESRQLFYLYFFLLVQMLLCACR